jgi:hypothetical protein
MGKFLASEKPFQARFKQSRYFSEAAQVCGLYKNHAYPFALPVACAEENLYPGIREVALQFFDKHQIKWHDGGKCRPSNHMCDSQVSCVNFLFPFHNQPEALACLIKPIFPTIKCMLPIEDESFVSFEWIGQTDYLHETGRNKTRSRGANCTSADAAVMFQGKDGKRQIVLIEWKYTETYSSTNLEIAKSGKSRAEIYYELFHADDSPIDRNKVLKYEYLFYEPFYQFMRQQLIANEMEKAQELGADSVSLLHISPDHNMEFKRITSPGLKGVGGSATGVWKKMVKDPDKFIAVSIEDLFGKFDPEDQDNLKSWYAYITSRYRWIS